MTTEQQLQDHEERIAALENAPKPVPHNTPETNPFMGRGPVGAPAEPINPDFQEVFGFWLDQNKHRRIAPEDQPTWLTKQQRFGGFVESWPGELQSGLERLIEHYNALDVDAMPKLIEYGSQQYLVFPKIPGVGYGTPKCFMVGVRNFLQDAADGQMDWTIEQIEKRRAK
jgi:hypothetical protein